MLLAWIGAVVVGLSLGLLGSGGSVLTVPVLVYLVGQEEKLAIAGSLFVVGTIALAGSLPFVRHHMVDWRNVALFGLPGMAGTWLGAAASAWIAGPVQLVLFAGVMLAAAWTMLRPPRLTTSGATARPAALIALDGALVGIVTGLVGVGGGFLIVPALVVLGGLPVHRAVATSLVIIALKSYSGLAKYLAVLGEAGLALDWPVLAKVTALGVAGSLVGSRLGRRLPQRTLRRGFAAVLVIMALVIGATTVPEVLGSSR